MDEVTEMTSLKLSVTNFGPIIEAAVDLRPLTVFVGPSNTGKSYLAILIYALHRFLGSGDFRFRRKHMRGDSIPPYWRSPVRRQRLSKRDTEILIDWAKCAFIESKSGKSRTDLPILLPRPINSLINTIFTEMIESNAYLNEEIRRCFGVEETSQLIRTEHQTAHT